MSGVTIHFFYRFDPRLTFSNLKNGSAQSNTVGQSERQQIWIPNLVFGNSVVDSYIHIDDLSSVFVKMDTLGQKKTNKDLQENEEYLGKPHRLSHKYKSFKIESIQIYF